MSISPERLRLALEQLVPESGFEFERFANAFLAVEIPDLRPVGGIHDGGRDAFIYASDEAPHVFCQHSVTAGWKRKINDTIEVLVTNGFQPRELIYTTNRDIQREADGLRASLRKQGVSLDIRDRSWFEAVANTSPARIVAAEQLATRYVDPLLSSRRVIGQMSLALTEEEERTVSTYLQLELRDKDPAKGLTKSCVEALITYTLRESNPERLLPRAVLHASIARNMPGSASQRAAELTDSSLKRLVRQNVVKHHTKDDAFTLAFPYREKVTERLQTMLLERAALRSECADRVEALALKLNVDFDYGAAAVGDDALLLIDHALCERGRLAALAMADKGDFFARRRPLEDIARELLKRDSSQFSCLALIGEEHFLALVPSVAEELALYPTEKLLARLRTASDAYCLQFMLQQSPDVQSSLRKIISGITLLVDTSVVVPCMAERLLPIEQRRLSNLLRGAAALGCRLIVGEDVLNETESHLDRIRYGFRIGTLGQTGSGAAQYFEPALVTAFVEARDAGRFNASFDEFVELFKGRDNPTQDLVEYLREDLSIEFDEMREQRDRISMGELGTLFDDWKAHKKKRPWMDETAFDRLVLHDVRTFLLVEHLRREAIEASGYGHRWWWLVIDGNSFHFDRVRRASGGGRVCMGPDFFSRYVSLAPKPPGMPSAARDLLPAALEVARLGLVPSDIREEAIRAYEAAKGLPEYLRRRRLRDLVNSAFVAHERIEETEVE